MSQILKKATSGFGYNYASLSDIVKQGIEIPQMRIKPTEWGDYIEYKDADGNWQIGSKVVIPEMKGKTAPQCYGAGLTYGRRYAAQLALGLVCSDDEDIENYRQPVEKSVEKRDLVGQINSCTSVDELNSLWKTLSATEQDGLRGFFSKKKSELKD